MISYRYANALELFLYSQLRNSWEQKWYHPAGLMFANKLVYFKKGLGALMHHPLPRIGNLSARQKQFNLQIYLMYIKECIHQAKVLYGVFGKWFIYRGSLLAWKNQTSKSSERMRLWRQMLTDRGVCFLWLLVCYDALNTCATTKDGAWLASAGCALLFTLYYGTHWVD